MRPEVPTLLCFPDYAAQGQAVAAALGAPTATVGLHRFPDGESRVCLPVPLPPHLVLVRSLDRPNDKLVELLLAARTAREQGARRLTLLAPYLCYMRQDTAFQPGEAISQRIVGRFLAELFDDVITVDPHLHRVATLAEAVPARRSLALSAAGPLGRFLAARAGAPLLLGPDAESAQWVRALAAPAGLDHGVAQKVRNGDRDVQVQLPGLTFAGRSVVLVDDMISTGHTAACAIRQLRAAGAASVACLVTHALFAPGAEALLREAGAEAIWSSDSIAHPTNTVPLAGLLADALRELLAH